VQLLSVRQPWAWAIARGRKRVENRTWAPSYRGPVAIYASMRVDLDAAESPLLWFAGWDPDDPVAAIGGIVAIVNLADVCAAAVNGEDCDCGEWAEPNAYHWRLTEPRPLARPVVSIGRSGHMTDVIPVRTIGSSGPAGEDSPAALWEPGPAVVAEVTAAAQLA
jgi:ASCH domain-containing protein